MSDWPGRKLWSLLLAALVLAAGTAPPALRHSHAGGEAPHDHHDHARSLSHSHGGPAHAHGHGGHAHSHARHHPPRSAEPGSSATVPAVHFHVLWLGMEFHLPGLPHEDDRDGSGRLPETCFVRLSGERLVSQPGLDIAKPRLDAHHVPAGRVPAEDVRVLLAGASPPLLSPPLCDVARHERSGVLLA